jgi:hypothetical protein
VAEWGSGGPSRCLNYLCPAVLYQLDVGVAEEAGIMRSQHFVIAVVILSGLLVGYLLSIEWSQPRQQAVLSESGQVLVNAAQEKAVGVMAEFMDAAGLGSAGATSGVEKALKAVDVDPDWGRLSRNRTDVVFLFARPIRGSLNSDELFRNEILNPGDVYIPPEARALLRVRIEEFEAIKSAFAEYRFAATSAEFDELMDAGNALSSPVPTRVGENGKQEHFLEGTELFQGRNPPIKRLQDGKVYYAYLDQLPATKVAHELYEVAATHFMSELTLFFVLHGGCSENEAQLMIEACLVEMRNSLVRWSHP